MRKKLSLFICIIMLLVALLPSFTFADGDKGLENSIKIAKSMFTIPSDFNFNYQMYMDNGKRIWALSWNSKDGIKGGINIRLDDNGTILSYDNYKPNENTQRKLPKISRQEAKTKAESFIKKINPSLMNQIMFQENNQPSSITDYTYSFNYVRLVNKIPFYANNVSISIDKDTGEAISYYYNWTDGLSFPPATKVISLKDAAKAYVENLGMKLIYKYTSENNKIKTYPAYVPNYADIYSIDALTGEKVSTGYNYLSLGGGGALYSKTMNTKDQVSLTPDEMKAIEEASKLISKEDAEKIARNSAVLKLTDDFKVTYVNLTRGWPTNNDIFWSLNFSTDNSDANKPINALNVNINAKTGEISNFNLNSSAGDKDPVKYDEAAAKSAVEDFLKSFNPDKFNQTEFYDISKDNITIQSTDAPRSFNFTYYRKVNGVQFPDNSITVSFDAVSGEITSYNLSWFDTEFAALDKIIAIDKANEFIFSQVGLELQYKTKYSQDYYNKINMGLPSTETPAVILVYSLKATKPSIIDAYTGTLLDYDGKQYKEIKPVSYTDIKGHYAQKQIQVLAEYGISLDGTKFKPDEKITQKDFLTLIAKIMPNYYGPYITSESKSTDVDSLYNYLVGEKILKESEKSPNATLTKEDSVKFFIKALKYDKVADIKGIFKCDFKDANKITPSLYGYFAIAEGLKIISADKKGNINPKVALTRAEAVVMIYNYLNE